jgi:hypothetical protein
MSQYGIVTLGVPNAVVSRVVQSADPDDMAARVNAAVAALPAGYTVIGITLAGAGDGATFTTTIDAGLASQVSGGFPVPPTVTCFLASEAQAMLIGLQNATPSAGSLGDVQVAGASKGAAFMGMVVQGVRAPLSAVPVSPGHVHALVNNQPTSLFQVDMSLVADNSFGCKMWFAVECTDGTDVQIREGDVNAAVAKKGASFTTAQAVNQTGALTAGTLTATFAWATSGDIATLRVTPASSLTPTAIAISYSVPYATHTSPAFEYV